MGRHRKVGRPKGSKIKHKRGRPRKVGRPKGSTKRSRGRPTGRRHQVHGYVIV